MTYDWTKYYNAAVLENNWSKMKGRIRTAEAAIRDREQLLALNHGSTPEENQAITDAMNNLNVLRRVAVSWSRGMKSE